jgi:hypothetical protein
MNTQSVYALTAKVLAMNAREKLTAPFERINPPTPINITAPT